MADILAAARFAAVEDLIAEKVDLTERLDAILDERDGLVQQIDELTERLADSEAT